MRKFFVSLNQLNENKINIIGEDVNHIKNVLRCEIGEKLDICIEENGTNYLCKIEEISKEYILCDVIEKIESKAESNVQLTIYQGLPKSDKMELIIQKCTELGVKRIVPVEMDRSIVKLVGKDEAKKIERWQKIAEMAAKQSKRDLIPEISHLENIKKICENLEKYDIVFVAYEDEDKTYLKQELKKLDKIENPKIAVVIGPEGGFDTKEINTLKESGAKIVTLGKRILRTETAPIALASIIMYELGDIGGTI